MFHLVLTAEQARLVTESANGIEVRDPQGRPLGVLHLLSAEEAALIEKAKQRLKSPAPRIPSARVQAMLKKFDQMQQTEEITSAKVEEVLRKVKSGEPL